MRETSSLATRIAVLITAVCCINKVLSLAAAFLHRYIKGVLNFYSNKQPKNLGMIINQEVNDTYNKVTPYLQLIVWFLCVILLTVSFNF